MASAPVVTGVTASIVTVRYMNISCDRISVCGSEYVDLGDDHVTEVYARAKGWHIWTGTTQGGQAQTVVLCPQCADAGRRKLPPVPGAVQGEQLTLELDT